MRTLPLILAMACGPASTEAPGDSEDTDLITFEGDDDDDTTTDTDTSETVLTGDFNGTEPGVVIAAPTFDALNRDDTPRSRDDLLGHPTVMWFFPLAGTPG